MGFRVQPPPIDIPEDDPFSNDLLDRRESAEVLTHLLASIEGPCVLAVDAAWGNGKTTFLGMWSQHLRNEGFPVVGFNAWETDFSEDPFIALSTELTEGLDELWDGGFHSGKGRQHEGSGWRGRPACRSGRNSRGDIGRSGPRPVTEGRGEVVGI